MVSRKPDSHCRGVRGNTYVDERGLKRMREKGKGRINACHQSHQHAHIGCTHELCELHMCTDLTQSIYYMDVCLYCCYLG